MINRIMADQMRAQAQWFPVLSVTGPRQSGKSTLVKSVFDAYAYANLEDPQLRREALEDPVGFIRTRPSKLIIDEAQYAPELFSVIQVVWTSVVRRGNISYRVRRTFCSLSASASRWREGSACSNCFLFRIRVS